MKNEKIMLIPFGVKNLNDRIFLESSFKKIPDKIPFLRKSEQEDPNILNILGYCDVEKEKDGIYIKPIFEFDKQFLYLLSLEKFSIVASGLGEFEEDGITIKNFELTGCFLTDKPAFIKHGE